MLDEKELKIDDKSAAIKALQSTARKAAVKKAAAEKRVIEADMIMKLPAEKNNRIREFKSGYINKGCHHSPSKLRTKSEQQQSTNQPSCGG